MICITSTDRMIDQGISMMLWSSHYSNASLEIEVSIRSYTQIANAIVQSLWMYDTWYERRCWKPAIKNLAMLNYTCETGEQVCCSLNSIRYTAFLKRWVVGSMLVLCDTWYRADLWPSSTHGRGICWYPIQGVLHGLIQGVVNQLYAIPFILCFKVLILRSISADVLGYQIGNLAPILSHLPSRCTRQALRIEFST